MSYTTIVKIWPNEKIECGGELRNSWGSAPVIWEAIYDKYGKHYCRKEYFGFMQAMDDLWEFHKNTIAHLHHRSVFMMTFDKSFVAKKDYQRAAKDIRNFLADFPQRSNRVNHWPCIAEMFESDPDIPAIGFWHTSVSDNPFDGPWNEEKEEYDLPDWDELYSIYDKIEEIDLEWTKKHTLDDGLDTMIVGK